MKASLISSTSMAFCLLIVCGTAGADSATVYSYTDGRTVAPLESTEITMVAETVMVTPEGGSYTEWEPQMVRVDCVFHFLNTGEEPVTAEVGFPFEAFVRGNYYSRPYWNPEGTIEQDIAEAISQGIPPDSLVPASLSFSATVDGAQVPVRYRYGELDPENRLAFWPMWAVWDMTFPPGRDVALRCSYGTAFSEHSYDKFDYGFTYITRTGALWEGPIGTALVTFTVPDSIPVPGLTGPKCCWWEWTGSPEVSGRTLRWEIQNWEPDLDLGFTAAGLLCATSQRYLDLELAPDTTFDWSCPESLYASAARFAGQIYLETDAMSLLPFLRDACRQQNGEGGPAEAYIFAVDGVPHPEWAQALDELQDGLREDQEAAGAAGYGVLLPMLALKRDWPNVNLGMYQADQSLEARYLSALEKLDGAMAGIAPEDPVLNGLYRLTGWFVEGRSALTGSTFQFDGFTPSLPRDSVLSWWRASAEAPLVIAASCEPPRSGQPFAFVTPSHPFPATPQVNSVLNDEDPASGWRSEASGPGHGEVLEAFVFPLPDGRISIEGFAVVNGFGRLHGEQRSWISKLLVRADGAPICVVQLEDGAGWQAVDFPEPLRGPEELTFEIIEAVPGIEDAPAGIAELRLL